MERLILVVGHESDDGGDLWRVSDALPSAVLTPPGPSLQHCVSELRDSGDGPAVVLPMTWGRDPVMVEETARTLHWLEPGDEDADVALAEPLGTTDDLVSLLVAASARAHTAAPAPDTAVVVAARPARPPDDAELYRVAHLVRAQSHLPVEAALLEEPDDLALAVRRARLLGAGSVTVVPAGFAHALPGADGIEGVAFHGPLLDQRALVRLVVRRAREARERAARGEAADARWIRADRDRVAADQEPCPRPGAGGGAAQGPRRHGS